MRDAQRRFVPVLFVIALGCGQQTERVEYDPPAVGPVRELVFSTTSFGDTNMVAERFTVPVRPEEQLAFTGTVAAPMPTTPGGMLKVSREHETRRVTYRTARVTLAGAEDNAGFEFRGETRAPQDPGKYLVEIKVRDPLLAMGEITVQLPKGR